MKREMSEIAGRIVGKICACRLHPAYAGLLPAVWWVDKMTKQEYFDYYPERYCGGMPKDKKIRKMLYGNIHGEDIWQKADWHDEFVKQFYTVNLPFFFLAGKKKKRFGKGNDSVEYEDGTVSYCDGRIVSGGETVKDGDFVKIPYMQGIAVYSGPNENVKVLTGYEKAEILEISAEGLVRVCEKKSVEGKISFACNRNTAYYIRKG